jgi:hypothetical protein
MVASGDRLPTFPIETKDSIMRLFKTDLFRNFAIGFAAGAVLVALQASPDVIGAVIPAAEAAPLR